MKRALFLVGAYYPEPKANGICCERVIREMQVHGYEVDVIAFATGWPCKDEVINNVNVYHIKGSLNYRAMLQIERKCNESSHYSYLKIINSMKNILTAPFWPDNSKICTRQFLKKAEELHFRNPYDVIIGVVSPISAVSAATRFKKKHMEVKYIAYFLDAVSGGVTPRILPNKLGIKKGLRWEKRVLCNADSVIVMQSHKKHVEQYCKDEAYFNRVKFLDIPLFDPTEVISKTNKDGMIHIVYIGAIQASVRNPDYFLSLLKYLPDNVVVDFYGTIDNMSIFAPYQSTNRIRIHGAITHDEALEIESRADVLLNIGNAFPGMVPSKIFEYMSTCKPIITTYKNVNDTSLEYLKNYSACLAIDEQNSTIEENTERLIHFLSDIPYITVDRERVKQVFTNNTPKAFVDEINVLLQ